MSGKSEFSLVTITAVMHHYADNRWLLVGPSRIGIYHNTLSNSFRVIARKIDTEHEVVANCPISETFFLNYEESTPSFHQWRDSTRIYGIKFFSHEDANIFSDTIQRIVHTFDQLQLLMPDTNGTEQSSNMTSSEQLSRQTSSISTQETSTFNTEESATTPVTSRPFKPLPPPPLPPLNAKSPSPQAGVSLNKGLERVPSTKPTGQSFLSEMELTLARRRAKIDALDESSIGGEQKPNKASSPKESHLQQPIANGFGRKWSLGAPNHSYNPQSSSDQVQVSPAAFERLKEELLAEVRQELLLFKTDLIETIKQARLSAPH